MCDIADLNVNPWCHHQVHLLLNSLVDPDEEVILKIKNRMTKNSQNSPSWKKTLKPNMENAEKAINIPALTLSLRQTTISLSKVTTSSAAVAGRKL
jgi:hypothetical protein